MKMDIKAELRLIRDKCPNAWKQMTQSEDRLCPLYFGIENYHGLPPCFNCGSLNECKECWKKSIEEETDGSNKRKENSKYCSNNNNAK